MGRRGRHQQAREISMNHHCAELLVILLWTYSSRVYLAHQRFARLGLERLAAWFR
jgi:hypothetical protein